MQSVVGIISPGRGQAVMLQDAPPHLHNRLLLTCNQYLDDYILILDFLKEG